MEFKTITPITRLSEIKEQIKVAETSNNNPTTSFADMYMGLIDNYKEAKAVSDNDAVLLATGSIDDLHSVTINAEKASFALNLTTTVTSKVLNAYNEIMKMNI